MTYIYVGSGGSHVPLVEAPHMSDEALRALLCSAVKAYEDAQKSASAMIWYSMQLYGRPDIPTNHADIRARELTGKYKAAAGIWWASMQEFGRPTMVGVEIWEEGP